MRTVFILIIVLLVVKPVQAEDRALETANGYTLTPWPVEVEDLTLYPEKLPGNWNWNWHIVKLQIQNGPHQLNYVKFDCLVANKDGDVWSIRKTAMFLQPNETRIVEIPIEDSWWHFRSEVKAECVIAGFRYRKDALD